MKYEFHERADHDETADSVGVWPGVASVHIERKADHFCFECARGIIGEELAERVKTEEPGTSHDKTEEFGNIRANLRLSGTEPTTGCGHCGIPLEA